MTSTLNPYFVSPSVHTESFFGMLQSAPRVLTADEHLLLYAEVNKYKRLIDKEDEILRIHGAKKTELQILRDKAERVYDQNGQSNRKSRWNVRKMWP